MNTKTRFRGLSYTRIGHGWQFVDTETSNQIGPRYSTEKDLLADVQRFAEERGLA